MLIFPTHKVIITCFTVLCPFICYLLPTEQALFGQANTIRSVDILQKKEYTYTYEEGKIVRAAEHTIEVNAGGLITSRTFENSIIYVYDSEGKLIKKKETPKEGIPQTTYYEHPENGNTVVKFRAGGQAVTSHSKTDSFGRKVFDELQLDLGFVSGQFSYHKGEATDTHVEQGKLKSSPTTQLASRIEFSDGRLMSYEYDEEERITKVTDSLNGVDNTDMGKAIGTKGERLIKVVFDTAGKIWTAYPMK